MSVEFWTPTEAAARAAKFLGETADHFLDVGSGSGKFALLAALLFPEKKIVGIEYRPTLVELSTALAQKAGLKNLEFVCGNAFDLNWTEFNGIYLFNPFHEQRYLPNTLDYIDESKVELNEDTYLSSANETRMRLASLHKGSRVALYNGFHDSLGLPPGYSVLERSFVNGSPLLKAQKIS